MDGPLQETGGVKKGGRKRKIEDRRQRTANVEILGDLCGLARDMKQMDMVATVVQTKPIAPGCPEMGADPEGSPLREPIARNIPNSRRSRVGRGQRDGGCACCTNKPNSRQAGREPPESLPRPCGPRPFPRRWYKQSQSPPHEREQTSDRHSAGIKRAKQSQFLAGTDVGQGLYGKGVMTNRAGQRCRQNKANFRGQGSGARGRGSAGLPVPPMGPAVQTRRARQKSGFSDLILGIGPETRVEIRLGDFCRGRQTKPIPGRWARMSLGQQRPDGYRAGTKCAKQSQLHPHVQKRARTRKGETCRDRLCETKPIHPEHKCRTSILWKRSYDGPGFQRALEKQSQFRKES
jgi:hypothetical protein